ncbi:MAG: potassium channel protein [Planctomycetota bacterium]|nr:potassium channel protein [Planctomycetota bacterium]MDP6941943.1 potassium channel protein [Planctomycetota bacterium]
MPSERSGRRVSTQREPLLLALWVIGVLIAGTLGYSVIESYPLMDAFYMTVITVSTVGFREIQPLSTAGQLFTIFLIIAGVGSFFFAGGVFARTLIANIPKREARRMQNSIDSLSGHVILCGFGRLGRIVRRELVRSNRRFVVIERDEELVSSLLKEKVFCLQGDATDEEVLRLAGVERAMGVIAAVGTDADNVFITLSSRQLNPKCSIVARAEDPRSEEKLKRVGATSVVTPYRLGGRRLAQAFLRPGAVDLSDLALGDLKHEVLIEEVVLPKGIPVDERTLLGLSLGARFGLIAVAVRSEGDLRFNPRAEEQLEEGDALMVMGHRVDIDAFSAAVADRS